MLTAILLLLAVFAIGGRYVCKIICPVGLIQELFFKIPFAKKWVKVSREEQLRKLKYVLLVLLIVLIPLVFIPNKESWKSGLLVVKLTGFATVFIASIFVYRPFCKILCPFGAAYGIFNKISFYRYDVDSSCNQCGLCERKCKMNIKAYESPNSPECIRCGKCIEICPQKAIHRKKEEANAKKR